MLPIYNPRDDANRQFEENFLKAILLVRTEKGRATVNNVSEAMNVSTSKSYLVIKDLVEEGLVHPLARCGSYKDGRAIQLTEAGETTAENLLEKYQLIYEWLVRIGVPPEDAEAEACRWEHSITRKMLEAIQKQIQAGNKSKRGRPTQMQLTPLLSHKEDTGKTELENILLQIKQYGGLEGIQRQNELIERAGGSQHMEELLSLVDEFGGFRKFKKKLKILTQMGTTTAQQKRTADQLERMQDLIEELGGIRRFNMRIKLLSQMEPDLIQRISDVDLLADTLETVDALGGVHKLKKQLQNSQRDIKQVLADRSEKAETLTKFEEMADAMGGIDGLVAIMYQSYKMWNALFVPPKQGE